MFVLFIIDHQVPYKLHPKSSLPDMNTLKRNRERHVSACLIVVLRKAWKYDYIYTRHSPGITFKLFCFGYNCIFGQVTCSICGFLVRLLMIPSLNLLPLCLNTFSKVHELASPDVTGNSTNSETKHWAFSESIDIKDKVLCTVTSDIFLPLHSEQPAIYELVKMVPTSLPPSDRFIDTFSSGSNLPT